jgi:hypothetical protein
MRRIIAGVVGVLAMTAVWQITSLAQNGEAPTVLRHHGVTSTTC